MAGNANSGNKANNKRTEAERLSLVKEGAKWLFDNPTAPRGTFVKWIGDAHGITSHSQAYKYRTWSYEMVHELQDSEIESKRTLRVAALEKLFHQAQQAEDIKAQLAVLQELNKVDNLYIQKVETTAKKDADIFKISLDSDNEDTPLKKVD